MKKILLGNEAVIKGALASGVAYVSGYPGSPAAEIGSEFGKIAKEHGIYSEWAVNEKVALESAIGASFSGLKTLVNMKNFGLNVCADSLLPLAYTGTRAPMVVITADDPSCWSSAQSEENSRGYAYLSHIPMLEPADPQECYDFVKLGYEISEKFNLPVILRLTTRVSHQKALVEFEPQKKVAFNAEFSKNPHQFCTMPPRVLEMKDELLAKLEKIRQLAEKSKINKIDRSLALNTSEIGIITSGVAYLHTKEALEVLGLDLPILKLGFFYPLPAERIKSFIKNLKTVLIVEELEGYLEKEVGVIAKDTNCRLKIFGKNFVPITGELDPEKICAALARVTGKKYTSPKTVPGNLPRRPARLCEGCPYWNILPNIKRIAPESTIYGGDIGCNMIAGLPPHNMQDFLFSMGASMGISHGVSKSLGLSFKSDKKVISIIGDGTFFHAGIPGLINAVYNKSNPLILVLDNRITAMTGHQENPGMGKTAMGEDTTELDIADIARACGVKNVKVLDAAIPGQLEAVLKEFLPKQEVSLIVCKHICALLERRMKKLA